MLCTFAVLLPGVHALRVLGESTAGASGFGCAGACRVVRVLVTQAAPFSFGGNRRPSDETLKLLRRPFCRAQNLGPHRFPSRR
jgi:hypothetical protein